MTVFFFKKKTGEPTQADFERPFLLLEFEGLFATGGDITYVARWGGEGTQVGVVPAGGHLRITRQKKEKVFF